MSVLLLFALTALSVATLASLFAYQRGAVARLGAGGPLGLLAAPAPARTLSDLEVGDVVSEGSEDWLVLGTADYVDEDVRWRVLRLEDGHKSRLLTILQKSDAIETAWLEPAPDVPLHGALGTGLTYRGLPYVLDRRGEARIAVQGVAHRAAGAVRYTRFRGPGTALVLIEEDRDAGQRTGFAGETVPSTVFDVLPGAGLAREDLRTFRPRGATGLG